MYKFTNTFTALLAIIVHMARANTIFRQIGTKVINTGSSSRYYAPTAAAFATPPSSSSSSSCTFFSHHQSYQHQKAGISFVATHQPNHHLSKNTLLLSSTKPSSADVVASGAAYHATVNQQIVARRNEVSRKKKAARQQALDTDRERNLKLRTLFLEEKDDNGSNNNTAAAHHAPPPMMFAIKVVTCPTLRSELKMNGREKRGRMFVERPPFFSDTEDSSSSDSETDNEEKDDDGDDVEYACMSLKALRQTIHEFFRRLKKSTYILSASLPTLDEKGNVLTHDDVGIEQTETVLGTWPLESDDDVQDAFAQAEDFFLQHREENSTSVMKRPTLVLHVTKDPNAPLPPPPPPYLTDMADPLNSPTMTMLSFYAFPPGDDDDGEQQEGRSGIPDPESTADQLKRLWRPFKALGRIYVAKEGINAQMAVPTNVLSNFLSCCTLPPTKGGELYNVLGPYMENGMNIDPIPVNMDEFRSDNPAFKNMHIRVRSQIVADGFETPYDWQSAGYDMPPLEWHQKLKEARESSDSDDDDSSSSPIVLDCRNEYETQVGKFELAEPLNTDNFRDSWDVLKERLKDVPKDAPIMTYCTGGIRCVKVNAYLTQELDFTNVARLAGGVVAYDRTINEQAPAEEPMFKGVNFVFDGRMGRRITEDQLGTCDTCGRKTHLVSNCKNENCHRRMVQCEFCNDSFFGTCSEGCKGRVVSLAGKSILALDEDEKKEASEGVFYSSLDDYSEAHSTDAAPLLSEIEKNTAKFLASGAHMVSGSTQGSLLTTLASMSRGGRVLEIGTFTGYATACFLKGAAAAGSVIGSHGIGSRDNKGPFVLSLERDRRALGLASAHLKAMSEFGIDAGGAAEAAKLRDSEAPDFDKDSIYFTYNNIAGCELRQVNDALATVEEMALNNPEELAFDIVFVDADKTRLMEYVDALASSDRVLKKGGLIIVDNVLWKGLVIDAASNGYDFGDESSQDKETIKKNRRARKLANKMHRFNSAVVKDERVDVLMMNLRDGLSMIRKR